MEMTTTLERDLEYWPPGATEPLPIKLRIGFPEERPEGGWKSTLLFEGFPSRPFDQIDLVGGDPIDAISYALAIAPLRLRLMYPRGGRLTHDGSEQLRFPSMFAAPSQHWKWTPSAGGAPRELGIRVGLPERDAERWNVVVTSTDHTTWRSIERRVEAATWPEVLELAARAVPELLREHGEMLGGGTVEEVHGEAACECASESD